VNNFIAGMTVKNSGVTLNIETCTNGLEGLEFILDMANSNITKLPEVILLDINMPVMDGWEFLEEYEKLLPSIKQKINIYMVSSSVHTEDIQRSKQYPYIKDFISKPLSKEKMELIRDSYFESH